jgi:hypothetical protein
MTLPARCDATEASPARTHAGRDAIIPTRRTLPRIPAPFGSTETIRMERAKSNRTGAAGPSRPQRSPKCLLNKEIRKPRRSPVSSLFPNILQIAQKNRSKNIANSVAPSPGPTDAPPANNRHTREPDEDTPDHP